MRELTLILTLALSFSLWRTERYQAGVSLFLILEQETKESSCVELSELLALP